MWWSWNYKTTIMETLDKNHNETMGALGKLNDTLQWIENRLGVGAASGRSRSAVPADLRPDVTSRAPVQ